MSDYPEHDKLMEVKEASQAIGEFLDYSGYTLCELHENHFFPTLKSISTILAEYFEIDQNKIEAEKRQMLESIREMNK